MKNLTKKEYNKLKEMGFLWEFFPEATGIWEDDRKQKNLSAEELKS